MAAANRFEDMLTKAREASMGNRDDIERSGQCGCYHCGSIFSKDEIDEWIEDAGGDTALCPPAASMRWSATPPSRSRPWC